MSKCKHPNITYVELSRLAREYTILEDELNQTGEPEPFVIEYQLETVGVDCHDCGTSWRYTKANMPKWLKERVDRYFAVKNS